MRLPARFSLIAKATCATAASRTSAIGRVDSMLPSSSGTRYCSPERPWDCHRRGPGSSLTHRLGAPNLTGDYTWQTTGRLRKGAFRPQRPFAASNE